MITEHKRPRAGFVYLSIKDSDAKQIEYRIINLSEPVTNDNYTDSSYDESEHCFIIGHKGEGSVIMAKEKGEEKPYYFRTVETPISISTKIKRQCLFSSKYVVKFKINSDKNLKIHGSYLKINVDNIEYMFGGPIYNGAKFIIAKTGKIIQDRLLQINFILSV